MLGIGPESLARIASQTEIPKSFSPQTACAGADDVPETFDPPPYSSGRDQAVHPSTEAGWLGRQYP